MKKNMTTTESANQESISFSANACIMLNAKEAGGKRYAVIPLSALAVEPIYQKIRAQHGMNNVHRIAATWEEAKYDPIKVVYRDDKFFIVDGNHRMMAAKERGMDSLYCEIIQAKTLQEEIRIFRELNQVKTRFNLSDNFPAMVWEGNPAAVIVQNTCDEMGFLIGSRGGKNGYLGSLNEAMKIAARSGKEGFTWVLNLVKELGWQDVRGGTSSYVLKGFGNVYVNQSRQLEKAKGNLRKALYGTIPAKVRSAAMAHYPNVSAREAMCLHLNGIAEMG